MFLTQINFLYQKSLERTFKTGFWAQIPLSISVLVLWNHKGFCLVKKLVWNFHIIAFWYTNDFMMQGNKIMISLSLVRHLRKFVSSLFSESFGTPIHLIFNTDLQSKVYSQLKKRLLVHPKCKIFFILLIG